MPALERVERRDGADLLVEDGAARGVGREGGRGGVRGDAKEAVDGEVRDDDRVAHGGECGVADADALDEAKPPHQRRVHGLAGVQGGVREVACGCC